MLFRLKPWQDIERMPDHPVRQFGILGIALRKPIWSAASSAPQRLLLAMDVALNPLRLRPGLQCAEAWQGIG